MKKFNPPKGPNVGGTPSPSRKPSPGPRTSSRPIIPERINSADTDAPLGDDAKTFIAIKPNVVNNPTQSTGFGGTVPPGVGHAPPPPPGFNSVPPIPNTIPPTNYPPPPGNYPPPSGQPGWNQAPGNIGSIPKSIGGGIGSGGQVGGTPQQYPGSFDQPSPTIQQTELSGEAGSTRVYALLVAAFVLVCGCFVVVSMLAKPEEQKQVMVIEEPTPRPIIEPTDDELVEPLEVAQVVETKPVKTVRRRPKAPAKPKVSNLKINIGPSSDTVTSINLTCDGYQKKLSGSSVTFTSVPSGTCNLKFNPGGAKYKGSLAGRSLSCTVTNGNEVRCK